MTWSHLATPNQVAAAIWENAFTTTTDEDAREEIRGNLKNKKDEKKKKSREYHQKSKDRKTPGALIQWFAPSE